MRGREQIIRDSVEGRSLIFEGAESDIIDTPEFQRLNYVSSLGCANLVYPNAQVKRYGHCLGSSVKAGDFGIRLGLTKEEIALLRLLLLKHDIGHGPFSHVAEKHCTVSHEEVTAGIITGRINLERPGCGRIPGILEHYGIDPQKIVQLLDGTYPSKALCSLVSGPFDCDKLDYLPRDALATGAKMGVIDLERIMDVMTINNGQLCLLEEGFDSALHLMNARSFMYRNVYKHPKTIVFESMLNLAVEHSGLGEWDLRRMTDDELLNHLAGEPGFCSEIVDMLKRRMPYDRLKELTIPSNYGRAENLAKARAIKAKENLADRLAAHARLPKDHVMVISRLPKEEAEIPYFPMILANGSVCNFFEYGDEQEAMVAQKRPSTNFYVLVAVHPSATERQKKRVIDMFNYTSGRV